MEWLTGSPAALLEVAVRTVVVFVAAAIGLRVARRRTVAQWTVVDVVTAVALGSVVGRTAVSTTEPLLGGLVALVVLLAVHSAVVQARRWSPVRRVTDHQVRVLVAHGESRTAEIKRCGLTPPDVEERLRLQGVRDLREVRYLLFERQGGLTVVREDDPEDCPLVQVALDDAAGWTQSGSVDEHRA